MGEERGLRGVLWSKEGGLRERGLGHEPEQSPLLSALEQLASVLGQPQGGPRCPFRAHGGVEHRWAQISVFLAEVGDLLFMVFPNGISLELREHLSSGEAAEPTSLGPGLWRQVLAPSLAFLGDCVAPEDQPPPAPSSQSSSTDDFCYVFLVELERGPSGLGMGLIDGMVSAPGQLLFRASVLFTKDGPTVQCVWSPGEEVRRPSKGLGQGAWWGHVWNLREMKGPRIGATSPTCCHFCPQTWGICPGPGDSVGIYCCPRRHDDDLGQAGPLG